MLRSLLARRLRTIAVSLVMAGTAAGGPQTVAPAAAAVRGPAAPSAPTATHRVSYDHYSVSIDGRRTVLWSGEFHYWRLPSPDLWRDVLQKMKAAGFNAVSVYFDWSYHSPAPGVYDFTGVRDVDRLLDMAQQAGLYVIARPGPYINAETSGGGFPGWLLTQQGRARSTDPQYLAAAGEWLGRIDRILARHQVSNGTGPVLLYQVENELYDPNGRAYMEALSRQVRADGITVPLVGNEPMASYAGGDGLDFAADLDQYVSFCDGKWWLPDLKRPDETKPLAILEAGTGWFQAWGSADPDRCRKTMGPPYQKVVYKYEMTRGTTIQNLYMAYGGTNWGWIADPAAAYTSYDYGAPISEGRQIGDAYDEIKRQGLFYTTTTALAQTDPATAPASSNPAVHVDARVNPQTRTQALYLRHDDANSGADDTTTLSWATPDGAYEVPARLNGKTAKVLLAGYDLGGQRLVYSTSELMTHATIGRRDVAILYGGDGDPGQTVFRYASQPTVTVLDGVARATWDAGRGDLRLDYTHSGLTRVLVRGGGRPDLLLLLGSDDAAGGFWRQDTAAGPVLERGSHLVRSASVAGTTLALTGDADKAGTLEIFAPGTVRRVTWNGQPLPVTATASGTLVGTLPGPRGVVLPELTRWRYAPETPEAVPGYDDSSWTTADHLDTDNPTRPGSLPVLYQDEYGFHQGYVWYRGHFRATGTEKSLSLTAFATNPAGNWARTGAYSVWLNGSFLGSQQTGQHTFVLPAGALRPGQDNVVAVLVGTMGHNQDFQYDSDDHKQPRGLIEASLGGSPAQITWRIQGTRGGEHPVDTVRGPMSTGGLYGERSGWTLPGYPDRSWRDVTLPNADPAPGVAWYRTTFPMHLPKGQDVSVGIRISDDPSRAYRSLIYVNGWLIGQYINDLGPQHVFPIPNGILRTDATNTIAVAAWNAGGTGGGLGRVSLEVLGNVASGLRIADVPSPGYDPDRYREPRAAARVDVTAPDTVEPGRSYQVSATVAVPHDGRPLHSVSVGLTLPARWSARPAGPVDVATLAPGASRSTTWTVSVPADAPRDTVAIVGARASFTRAGRRGSAVDERVVAIPPPPLAAGRHYISDLPLRSVTNGWGPVERDTSNGEDRPGDGRPITLHDAVYPKGLGVHAPSTVTVWLGGTCTTFHAALGLDQEVYGSPPDYATVAYTVLADGLPIYSGGRLDRHASTQLVDLPVTGARQLELVVADAGDGNAFDHADWADAQVLCE
jgi:beta-galactosidase